jgi:hypothetical protein
MIIDNHFFILTNKRISMKKALLFLVFGVSLLLGGCVKNELLITSTLSNNSTRTWKLEMLYKNDQAQTLTPGQLIYTKTYKKDNTWEDSDGYKGTYTLPTEKLLKEITTNSSGGSLTIDYTIIKITVESLTVEYTFNQDKYKFVYKL